MGSEPPPVADLVRLGAGGEVGACGAALVVHHPGGRLVQHALAGRADGECKVGVFVVGRRVARVEAAHLSEQRARDGDGRAACVVDVAPIAVPRVGGAQWAAVCPAATLAPPPPPSPPTPPTPLPPLPTHPP